MGLSFFVLGFFRISVLKLSPRKTVARIMKWLLEKKLMP